MSASRFSSSLVVDVWIRWPGLFFFFLLFLEHSSPASFWALAHLPLPSALVCSLSFLPLFLSFSSFSHSKDHQTHLSLIRNICPQCARSWNKPFSLAGNTDAIYSQTSNGETSTSTVNNPAELQFTSVLKDNMKHYVKRVQFCNVIVFRSETLKCSCNCNKVTLDTIVWICQM